jgi:hypothetical protein
MIPIHTIGIFVTYSLLTLKNYTVSRNIELQRILTDGRNQIYSYGSLTS